MKKLRRIKSILKGAMKEYKKRKVKLFGSIDGEHTDEFSWLLKELGFNYVSKYHSASCGIWVDRKRKIVIKVPYLCASRPKSALITYTVKIPGVGNPKERKKNTFHPRPMYTHIFIQPLVSLKACRRAMKVIKKKFGNAADLHMKNCGWYRNKAVMFDW